MSKHPTWHYGIAIPLAFVQVALAIYAIRSVAGMYVPDLRVDLSEAVGLYFVGRIASLNASLALDKESSPLVDRAAEILAVLIAWGISALVWWAGS